jgi:membrane fusion protein (multidrug efflux system)
MMKLMRYAAPIVAGLLMWGCASDNAQNRESMPVDPVVNVELAPIRQRTIPVEIVVDGQTDVLDRQMIVSPIDGTVVSLMVKIDSDVHLGDTLALIRSRDSEASIAGARRLLEEATTSRQRNDARRALQLAEENQQVIPVIAGRSGVVVNRIISAGQTVQANSELLELVDLSTLDFVAYVPLSELTQVAVGQQCRVDFPAIPDRTFSGEVAAVGVQSDQGSQSLPVRIEFDEPALQTSSKISVGMMGTASITVGEHPNVLVVPASALLRDDINNTYTIYTVGSDSLARQVPVEVGIFADSIAEIAGPSLHAGQSVIIKGNYEVSDSTRVRVEAGHQQ